MAIVSVRKWLAVAAVWCAVAASSAAAVDRSKFRTCDQTQFCKKYRFGSPQQYEVVAATVVQEPHAVHFDLVDAAAPHQPLRGRLEFVLDAAASTQPAVRLHVEEKWADPADPKKRWENQDVLTADARATRPIRRVTAAESGLTGRVAPDAVLLAQADVVVALQLAPFGVDVFLDKRKVVSTNSDKQFHFEARRDRAAVGGAGADADAPAAGSAETPDVHEGKTIVDYGEDGLAIYSDGSVQKKAESADADAATPAPSGDDDGWEESFGGHTDKKKFGPSSVGLDVSFHGERRGLYGIPEHASDFLLKNTLDASGSAVSDPYRLYNLDVFEYELDVPMTLYGSIPLLVSPDASSTVGVFWHNPSETFVDIATKSDGTKTSHWLSESGVVDLFVLLGPTSRDFFAQYTLLTGRAPLPPLFALAYHQCRWNYKNEPDVARVDAGFDEHLIPYDVLWLDIEHTNGKRYFTWDEHAFPTPRNMLERVARTGRKMVTIVDPHIKVDNGYYVHDEATEKGLYVKDEDGKDFNGWCWPGNSAYVDFTSPKARRWWSGLFRYEKYEGSTKDLFTWNDMNEPSVFNGPEVSMRKTCTNLDGVEHREWHNLYGFYLQQATMEGQLVRQLPAAIDETQALTASRDMQRPFVLSRAFFAGSQRFGAVWTGDNAAQWGHLKYATKMLLSMSVAGLTFVGADVGGFFGNPDTELLTRWYQAGAFQPFFRGHAHHDSARREPWLFGEPHTTRLRNAIRWRYALLPYVYTLFHTCATDGQPVMRPLWMHFPQNPESFTEEDEFLLGEDLLVKPIVDAGVVETDVFLPGDASSDVWYNIFDGYKRLAAGRVHHAVAAPLDYTPVFQRGGSIVPRKNRVRRSSALMKTDPLTLSVALDGHGRATGQLYADDEQTFAFSTDQAFTTVTLTADASSGIRATVGHKKFASSVWVERIEVYGLQGKTPKRVTLVNGAELETQYDATQDLLVIRKPAVFATEAWEIRFE